MSSTKKSTPVRIQPNPARHECRCSICAHPQREEIEFDYLRWGSPTKIVDEYGLKNRSAVYRHMAAVGLAAKRDRNIRAALARIIERGDEVPVTAGAVVQAVALFARMNARGALVERQDIIDVNELIEEMSSDEQRRFAEDGTAPAWFAQKLWGSDKSSQGGDDGQS